MAQTKVKLISDGVIVQSNLHASHGITTADIGEGSNLYYTDGRVGSYLSSNGYATQTDIVATITDSAPVTLDTLNELAAALGDDPNFATTTATSLGLKAPLASPSFTGNATFAGKITSGNDIVNATAGVYTWVDDTDTYIQRSAGNEITFKTGASTALVLNSSQNATFTGEIRTSNRLAIKETNFGYSSSYKVIQVGESAATKGISLGYDPSGNTSGSFSGNEILIPNNIRVLAPAANNSGYYGLMMLNSSNKVLLGASNYLMESNYIMALDTATKNVGIGTDSPSQELDVVGIIKSSGVSNSLMFSDRNTASNTWEWYSSGDNAGLYKNHNTADTVMTIDSLGKVGIGTTPTEMLHIKGGGNGPEIRLEGTWGSHYIRAYNDNWNFLVGGTVQAISIKNNGSVGIGTTSPQHLLHLKSTISGPTGIIIENTNNAQSLDIDFWNNAGAAQGRIRYNEGAGSFDFFPNVGASSAMTMLYGGNVGIGTTSPESGAKLDVRAGSGGKIVLGSYNANYKIVVEGGDQLNFYNGTSPARAYINYGYSGAPGDTLLSRNLFIEANSNGGTTGTVRIKSDGKVGIGTTSPEAKLDISNVAGGTYALEISTPERNRALFFYNSASASDAGYLGIKRGGVDALNHRFATTANSAVCIGEGNFGIGTDSPNKKLTVYGGNDNGIWVDSSGSQYTSVAWGNNGSEKANIAYDNTNANFALTAYGASNTLFTTNGSERMRITSGGKTLIGITTEQNAGHLQMQSGTSENGGILDIAGGGWYRYYTRVCRNATSVSTAGYWHIKTNIVVNSNTMFMAKFYGYIYGSAQIVELTHAGYAYSGSNTVINQAATNNGSEPNASSAIYSSTNGNKVTFRIAFGTGTTFSTYFAGLMMDMAFPAPAGQGHDFEIEAQTFSQNTTVY